MVYCSGNGIFILPFLDLILNNNIFNYLVALGWNPSQLKMLTNANIFYYFTQDEIDSLCITISDYIMEVLNYGISNGNNVGN